jgi:integrase
MARRTLTDRKIKSLKPAPKGKRYIETDGIVPGMGVRVTDTGNKSYVLVARFPSNPKHPTPRALAEVGEITLVAARDRARNWLELIQRSIDPKTEEARQRAVNARQQAETFGKVAEAYKAGHLDKKRSGPLTWASLQADLLPHWKDLPVRDLTRGSIMERLDAVERNRGPVARNRRLALVRHLLNWALDREWVTANVAARIPLLDEAPRERVLSDAELAEVWRASDGLPAPQGQAIKLLILTMQRRNEVFRMETAELDRADGLWKIEGRRMKAGKPHIVPLTEAMLAVLDSLPQFDPPRDHVFASPHRRQSTPFGDHGGLKNELDRLILEARQKSDPKARPPTPWTLHDIRRTGRTGLSRLRVPSHIAERVLAHVPGGIQAVYDQWEYMIEKRQALEAWSVYVNNLVDPKPKVTPIEQAREKRDKRGGK